MAAGSCHPVSWRAPRQRLPTTVTESFSSHFGNNFGAQGTPKGPKIEKNQSCLNFSISLENFNLAWKFQSGSSEFHTKIRVWWMACLKFQSRSKNSIPEGDLECFQFWERKPQAETEKYSSKIEKGQLQTEIFQLWEKKLHSGPEAWGNILRRGVEG